MATLGDLQTRIITETNRDDLADVLSGAMNQAISDAISDYTNERFWFNEAAVVTTVLANQQYTPLPSGYESITDVWVQVGGVQFWLKKTTNEYLQSLYAIPQIGQPIYWAPFQLQARLWPTPNTTYPLTWLTVSDVQPALIYTAPVPDPSPTNLNNWTTDGMWLICARAKELLYRNVLKDPDQMALCKLDVDEAYGNLKGISNRRLSTGRMRAAW
jgi:hypothetical protein